MTVDMLPVETVQASGMSISASYRPPVCPVLCSGHCWENCGSFGKAPEGTVLSSRAFRFSHARLSLVRLERRGDFPGRARGREENKPMTGSLAWPAGQ